MRLQLALNVRDLDAAIDFYSKLFDTTPYKTKPGYANFAVDNPALKLVLFENPLAVDGSINHLGVETDTADEVESAEARLRGEGLTTSGIDDTICCYAEKVETWVNAPDGNRWEYYVKTADHDSVLDNTILSHRDGAEAETTCCAPDPAATAEGASDDAGAETCCAPADAEAPVTAGVAAGAESTPTTSCC